jgi:hypothetical protein
MEKPARLKSERVASMRLPEGRPKVRIGSAIKIEIGGQNIGFSRRYWEAPNQIASFKGRFML